MRARKRPVTNWGKVPSSPGGLCEEAVPAAAFLFSLKSLLAQFQHKVRRTLVPLPSRAHDAVPTSSSFREWMVKSRHTVCAGDHSVWPGELRPPHCLAPGCLATATITSREGKPTQPRLQVSPNRRPVEHPRHHECVPS